ncbi:hypothetical protein F5876DRAFT_65848 [Lentinula aff. lateritia]|uniref:Uncharacterized protein n=1 Tax=Lentinula aff. lateritia TaxID=2804960 RepID=A0ACC1TZT3_9AGAR|nr:hypothetical protein F5876DRAFT_65848 [Lentinula aff. lateritia]
MGPNRTPKTIRHRVPAPRSSPRRHNMLLHSITRPVEIIQTPATVDPPTPNSPVCTSAHSFFNIETSVCPHIPSLVPPSDDLPKPEEASSSSLDLPLDLVMSEEPDASSILETMFSETREKFYEEQEKSIQFAIEYAELLSQQCSDSAKIILLKDIMRKLDYSCPLCKNLAWNPHSIMWTHYVLEVYHH